jgi:hypothetical protein
VKSEGFALIFSFAEIGVDLSETFLMTNGYTSFAMIVTAEATVAGATKTPGPMSLLSIHCLLSFLTSAFCTLA